MVERISRAAMDAGLSDVRDEARRALAMTEAKVAEHWGWYLALGVVLLLAGMAAIAFPFLSTLAANIALGWIFLISGGAAVVHAFTAGEWRGFFLNLLIGLLYVVAGAYLVLLPPAGILTLAMLLAALLIASGVLEAAMAFRIRPHEGWGWVLASALAAIALGVLIALKLPSSAIWAIGLLVGVKMIFAGWSFISLALAGRRWMSPATARPI
jgi:uncharacterized membrane protein HdeD (DUF308 family)